MKPEEVFDLFNRLPAILENNELDLVEQATVLAAMETFAITIEPIVVKYSATNNGPSTFLFKL